MLKLLLISQLVQPYFNPEFGGVLYYKWEKIFDTSYAKNEMNYEFLIKSPVDPYFIFYGTFPLTFEGMELEEAYAKTLTLPFELTFGKFKSRFTRLNSMHKHAWDFPELPVIYNKLMGEEGVNIIGAEISYIFPFNFFFEPGIDIFKGESERFENFISYIHFSFDLPLYITLWFAPSFYFENDSIKWFGSEIVLKRIRPGEERLKGLIFTGGYFQNAHFKEGEGSKGGYFDFVYKFTYGWRVGFRTDLIYKEKPEYTAMIDYSPTEFSRFRLSYKFNERKIIFEFNFSVGPHGAHPF